MSLLLLLKGEEEAGEASSFVRHFDGAEDAIVCEIGHCDTATSAFTMAFLVRRAVNGTLQTLAALHGHSEKSRHMAYFTASNKLGLRDSIGNSSGGTPFDWAAAGWVLAIVTKPAGLALPRFHYYVFATETWVHEDGDTEIADAAGSSATLWLGGAKEFGSLNGDIAAAMVLKEELDDAGVESLLDVDELIDWLELSPAGLHLLKQDSVEDLVIDYTYNHGDAPAEGILGTEPIAEDPPIPYGTPPLPPSRFNGDFETRDISQFESMQALLERVNVVSRSALPFFIRGRYGVRLEVQGGDVEPATGSQRAELVSGLRFYGGEHPYFRVYFQVEQWDFDYWGMVWQLHDNTSLSPPLALQISGTKEEPFLELVPFGKNGERYWKAPFQLGEPTEVIVHPYLSDEGSIEIWLNTGKGRVKQTLENGETLMEGINTLGVPMTYDKAPSIYRSKDAVETAVVYHDSYWVGLTFPPSLRSASVAINREFPPTKHCVIVRDPKTSAPIARWAEDEAKAHNVMGGLRLSGTMPGGKKELRCSLPRNPRHDWPDMEGFLEIEAQLPGRNRVWHGRIGKAPRSDGERMVIDGEAVGYAAALEDRKALRLGFIDGDHGKWGEPSTQRRINLIDAGIRLMAATSVGHSSADPEAVAAAIINDFTNVETVETDTEAGEAHYSSGGVDIGGVPYDFLGDLAKGEGSTNWESNIALGLNDTFSGGAIVGTDHDADAASNRSVLATGPGYKFARIRNRLNAVSEGAALKRIFGWQPKVISLLASQNLTLQGTWPNVGYTAAQMLRLAVPEFSELLATDESVEDDGLVISDAWYSDPGTLARVVDDLVKYGLYDWFVKDAKLFELREPGTYGRRWQASQGPSNFQEAGTDTERAWDRIMGAYRDPDGTTRYVGWPGSGAEVESEQLIITDPDHPAVRTETVREDLLDLQVQSTPERAIEVCERWLAEANELSRSGKARLTGYVQDESGVFYPAAEVAEGDLLRFRDARDKSYRKIVNYDYAGDELAVDVDLDAPSEDVKALLERYRAALYPLGIR